MKYSLSVAAIAAASIVSASPVAKRQAAITDVEILNYALTLEHLEDFFYRDGLKNYTQQMFIDAGFADPFYENLQEVSYDESTHVSFLSEALGDAAVVECVYNFPSTDVASFVALASVLEGVGVAAYIGAAAYIADPTYLTAAASILSIEARHSSYFRAVQSETPFPQPFDDALDFDEVRTLAASFIVSCPASEASKPLPPLKTFPSLALATTGTIASGDTVVIATPGYSLVPISGESTPLYAAFLTLTGPIFADATPVDGGFEVVVPQGVNGQSYAVLTGCNEAVTDATIVAGPVILEITNPVPTTS